MRDCDAEFGPHDHDDVECGILLARMSEPFGTDGWDDTTDDNLNTSGSIGFSVFNE